MSTTATGFNAAYKTLNENMEKLRNQSDLDIDGLVPLVEQSSECYRICKERIEAARKALESHLKDGSPSE